MKHDADKQQRRSIRLPGYDYAQAGAYFVTIVTKDRMCLFGEIVDREMLPNQFGRDRSIDWNDLPDHYPAVECDSFVVMPNHVHGIIELAHGGADGRHIRRRGRFETCPGRGGWSEFAQGGFKTRPYVGRDHSGVQNIFCAPD